MKKLRALKKQLYDRAAHARRLWKDWRKRVRLGKRQNKPRDVVKHRKDRRRHFDEVRDRLLARIKRIRIRIDRLRKKDDSRWPETFPISEILYHLGHFHLASPDRDKLIQVCKILQARGIRVGEFPPFDVVEDVHVDGSWHYRDSSSPWTPRSFRFRGNGLATDLNDADGGSDKEYAAYIEIRARYV